MIFIPAEAVYVNPDDRAGNDEFVRDLSVTDQPQPGSVIGHSTGLEPASDQNSLIADFATNVIRIDVTRSGDAAYRNEITNTVRVYDTTVLDICDLPRWSDADRWRALELIVACGPNVRVRSGNSEPGNLFDAIVAAMVGPSDILACERSRIAAIEAAVLVHPDAIEVACQRILDRLRELRIRSFKLQHLIAEANQLAAQSRGANRERATEESRVREVISDAPVPEDAVIPPGWSLSDRGIAAIKSDDPEYNVPAPVLITQRMHGVDDNSEFLEIAWKKDESWNYRVVSRRMIATAQSIVELAAYGVPVTSNNAKQLVQFLLDFETVNLDCLPRSLVARQLGWQGVDGEHGFLWGHQLIRTEPASDVTTPPRGCNSGVQKVPLRVVFRGADDGDDQLADGFKEKGSFDVWRDSLACLAGFVRIQFLVYAAIVSAILKILGTDNFVCSLAGATSQGKTISLRIAASCWGCPDEKSPSAVMASWDATRVWFGRAPAITNDLPLVVDDTKRANDRKVIAQMLYDVASGRGKGRGSREGLARNDAFHTAMLTTGEAPITSFSQDGGTRPRTLELWGSPFGGTNAEIARLVNGVNDAVMENYGHLGPRFIDFLQRNRSQWHAWRDRFRELRAEFMARAGTNSVAARMGSHLAAVKVAAELVHEAVEMPWPHRDVVEELYQELVAETAEADRAAAALRHVLSWVHAHRNDFFTQRARREQPHSGWAGRWEFNAPHDGYIGLFPHVLDAILENAGFEPEPIKRLWHDRGWMRETPGKRSYRTRVDGEIVSLCAIRREAIEAIEEPGEVEDDRMCRPAGLPIRPGSEQTGAIAP